MWRLLPILVGLAFVELLVPWPDVAALVLSNAYAPATHDIAAAGLARQSTGR